MHYFSLKLETRISKRKKIEQVSSELEPIQKLPTEKIPCCPLSRYFTPQSGFTLIEIMVVVVIIGMLVTLILPKVLDRQDQAAQVKAKADIHSLSSSIKLYKLDNFKYPTSSEGLGALLSSGQGNKGYIERLPKDPWGNDYQYQQPGQHMDFDVWSFGADGQSGGSELGQDIGNWNSDEIK